MDMQYQREAWWEETLHCIIYQGWDQLLLFIWHSCFWLQGKKPCVKRNSNSPPVALPFLRHGCPSPWPPCLSGSGQGSSGHESGMRLASYVSLKSSLSQRIAFSRPPLYSINAIWEKDIIAVNFISTQPLQMLLNLYTVACKHETSKVTSCTVGVIYLVHQIKIWHPNIQ